MLLARSLVESTTGRLRTARTNGKGAGAGWTCWIGRSSDILLARHAWGEAKRLDDRAQAGLRGQARHRGHCSVGNVEPDRGTLEDAGGLGPADVMGVKVNRQAYLLTQRLDQFLGGATFRWRKGSARGARKTRPRGACHACGAGLPAATDGRRGRSCR